VGYALASAEQHPPVVACRDFGHIDNLVVDADFRRRGAGRLMVEYTVEWFTGRGITRTELDVSELNLAGLAFWRAVGFNDFQRVMVRKENAGPERG